MNRLKICLETSSYLPLIWITPYSQGVINLIEQYRSNSDFYIQQDCLKEALSYIYYQQDWFRHPSVRIRKIAQKLEEQQLNKMSFPSSAFQILLGGKMWTQGRYLNFVRHTTFLYSDLVDIVDFSDKRKGLLELAKHIDRRFDFLKFLIEKHLKNNNFTLNFERMLPYWGRFYLDLELPKKLAVNVWEDPERFDNNDSRSRDLYHYDSMIKSDFGFGKMIVANTGFWSYVKKERDNLPIEVICSQSCQKDIFE